MLVKHVVDSVVERAGLLTHGKLDVTVHSRDSVVGAAATLGKLLSDSHVALLNGIDNLLSAHAHLVADVAHLCRQSVDSSLYLPLGAVQLCGEVANRVPVAADSVHEKRTAIVVVNLVGHIASTAVVAETAPAVAAPAHEEEKEYHPHEPAAFAKAAIALVHR